MKTNSRQESLCHYLGIKIQHKELGFFCSVARPNSTNLNKINDNSGQPE